MQTAPRKAMNGVQGFTRRDRGRVLDVVSDRGPAALSDMEGDFVHSVGLLIGSRRFAYRSFGDAVVAWKKRLGLSNAAAARRLGVDDSFLLRLIKGRKFPSDELLCRLRTIICEGES